MKAIIFTLDAIFALTIAAMCISLLLLFPYLSQTPYSVRYSNAQALLTNLASTPIESIQNSSTLARAMAIQYTGANETSPQFLSGPNRNSSNDVGPLRPILTFSYAPGNAITTGVVADYGNIYFAANSILYAVNATTNRTVWTKSVVTNVVSTPALSSGLLYFANSTNLTAVNAKTGAVAWSTSAISGIAPVTSAITVYDNQVIFGASDNYIHAYYANNGTSMWVNYTGSTVGSLAMLKGNMAVKTASNYFAILLQGGKDAKQLFSKTYGITNIPTNLATAGTKTYFGTASTLNASNPDGTVASGFPVAAGSTATGVAIYKNYIVYQTASKVIALSPSGGTYWSVTVPSSYGAAPTNATPAVSGSMIYTMWSNGIAGQNLTSGVLQWFALLPRGTGSPYMTLAYGRLYVVANNKVLSYGACSTPQSASLLSAAATMYFNSQAGCGTALLNAAYPMSNYSFFSANVLSRSVKTASFNGATGFISAKNTAALNSSYVSVSFWINISAYTTPTGMRPINYGSNGGCIAPALYCGWFFYISNLGAIQFNVLNGNQLFVNGPVLSTNTLYHITGVYNNTYLSLYVNSNTPYKTAASGVIAPTSPNINLTMGAGPQPTDTRYLTGNMANIQIYSKPLTRTQVSQLYLRGMQGAPLNSMGLAAWYPLAGDANDYAGFNTGYASASVKFATRSYTPASLLNAYEITRASTLLPVMNFTNGATNTILVGVYSWN